ncbi:adhesive domain-containing protein [Bacillus pseudomycoides]|uniref:Adhesive domain-containing protein n=1 Tax=Bacillus bingmayongensis TaxID=1150157 RepID=A0ABU5JTF8_9BACI|nr:adhesive domain-containing protein [Bacillus pseudomycoides]
MRKIMLSVMAILLVFSGLNVSVAETFVSDENPEMNRLLPDGRKTKDPGIVTKDEDITLDLSYPGAADKTMIIPLGDYFTYNEAKTKELLKDQQDVTVTYQKEKQQLEITWKAEKKESAVFSLNASKTGQTEIKAAEQQEKTESNILEIDIQDAKTTAGEEKPAVTGEEKPAVAGEEKPAVAGEEKPAVAGEEKPAVTGEEKPAVAGEEKPAVAGEERPAVAGEEKPAVAGEEKPAVQTEEQTKLDSEGKAETKEAVPEPRAKIKLTDVGEIGNIDFSQLDDSPNELAGFTQMTTNKGLEFPTKEKNGRTYYMYFGDLATLYRTVESLEGEGTNGLDDWNRPLPTMNTNLSTLVSGGKYVEAQNFSVITALDVSPKQSRGVVSYYFNGGQASSDSGNGLRVAHGNSPDDSVKFQSGKMPILKLYKNEATHELVAYAAVIDGQYLDGYVRIKMSPVNNKGRINVSMKYLKLSDTYTYTNFGYTVHMDIANRHMASRMYSLGDNKGLYFNEEKLDDGQDYLLYFFRDGYANHPVEFKGNNNPAGTKPFSITNFNQLNAAGTPDPGKDVMYPFTTHPGWALRWDPKLQEPNTVREENLEIAVTAKQVPPVIKLDNDGEYTDNGYHIQGTWKDEDSENVSLYYTVDGSEPKKIGDYKNPNENTDVPWEYTIPSSEMEQGLDHDITVYVIDEDDLQSNIETIKIRPALTITEKVLDADGNEAKEIAPGETLNYEVSVDSGYIAKDTGTYGDVTITQKYDTHLEVPTDLKVTDENGNEIGTATYNAATNSIEVKLNADTPRSTKVKVTYNAKVKDDATEGEFVVGQATAAGKYSTGDEVNKTSNEVKVVINGVLNFISAPQVINFGEKLTISPQDKTYYPINIDTPLAVKDNRTLSKKTAWIMTAKLDQPLTGKKTGATLEGLHYRYGGNDSILSEDASVEIYKKETTDNKVVNISDTWSQEGDGLYLAVRAGTAKHDAYEGTINWVLQDVPTNN